SVPCQLLPRPAVLFRATQSAARSAARQQPRLASRLPERRKNNVRIMWIEHYVDPARVFVFTQNFRPRFAAVGGSKDSALLIWTERVSESSHQNHVGISWIDNQRADLTTVFESDIFPGFAGVDGFVNADSISGVAA